MSKSDSKITGSGQPSLPFYKTQFSNPRFPHPLLFQFHILSQIQIADRMKMMKLFAVMLVMTTAVSAVYVSAAEAPAPAPTSDATTVFVPAAVVSVSAFVYAFLF
ncbi:hypothetical protein L1987_04600 [Smallanthus sonchifolius]|uniref:Uncharacterized protein n=1 Tax=Smallanthus sonchifolius TaxID=185202 RepID=A0ACB9JT10_9ASTR|nr:hypothetical protein L1987_04600 [Smallanthus sonchifolius]